MLAFEPKASHFSLEWGIFSSDQPDAGSLRLNQANRATGRVRFLTSELSYPLRGWMRFDDENRPCSGFEARGATRSREFQTSPSPPRRPLPGPRRQAPADSIVLRQPAARGRASYFMLCIGAACPAKRSGGGGSVAQIGRSSDSRRKACDISDQRVQSSHRRPQLAFW
jgi:hypothetical protein